MNLDRENTSGVGYAPQGSPVELTGLTGTLDEMEPLLRARGFVAVRTMAGPIDLAAFDPYGMRRIGSVNIQSERWAHHIYKGRLAFIEDRPYLADAERPSPGFLGGLFPLLTQAEV